MIEDLVSIVVINYNGRKFLDECLRSVSNQSVDNYEIILVDNGSTDGSEEFTKKNFPDIRIIKINDNCGFSKGNNFGVKNSKGRFVVLLNNDTKVEKNFVECLYKAIKTRPDCGAVSASMYDGHNLPDMSLGGLSVLGYCLTRKVFETVPEQFLVGLAAGIFDRQKIPLPFDEDYFLFYEDIYFAWLNRLKGYKTYITPDTMVLHYGSGTTGKRSKTKVFYGERNRIMNLLLFYSGSTLAKLAPLILLNAAAAPIRSLLVYRDDPYFITYIKSYIWIIRHFWLVLEKRKAIQKQRRVKDGEIFNLMTYKISDGMMRNILNTMSRAYCRVIGIKTFDMK